MINNSLQEENGSVMIAALLVMALLTLIGTMSINNTTTELQIATNEIRHKQDMHRAEAAVMEGLKKVQGIAADPVNRHKIKDEDLKGFGTAMYVGKGTYTLEYAPASGNAMGMVGTGAGAGNLRTYSVLIRGESGDVKVTVESRIDF